MSKFAKLFEVEDNQVLVTLGYNKDSDQDYIQFKTHIDGIVASIDIEGFDTKASAKEAFSKVGVKEAKYALSNMAELLTNNDE